MSQKTQIIPVFLTHEQVVEHLLHIGSDRNSFFPEVQQDFQKTVYSPGPFRSTLLREVLWILVEESNTTLALLVFFSVIHTKQRQMPDLSYTTGSVLFV